jgi:hypothetical protein
MKKKGEDLDFKLGISMIMDFLQKNDFAYTTSVIVPESGIGSSYMSKTEIEEILKISTHESKAHQSLIQSIIQSIWHGQMVRPNQVTMSC